MNPPEMPKYVCPKCSEDMLMVGANGEGTSETPGECKRHPGVQMVPGSEIMVKLLRQSISAMNEHLLDVQDRLRDANDDRETLKEDIVDLFHHTIGVLNGVSSLSDAMKDVFKALGPEMLFQAVPPGPLLAIRSAIERALKSKPSAFAQGTATPEPTTQDPKEEK